MSQLHLGQPSVIGANATYSSRFEEELLYRDRPQSAIDNNRLVYNPTTQENHLTISTSGFRGQDGSDGHRGGLNGGRGGDGQDGRPGQHAERNIVGIRSSDDTLILTRVLPPVNNSSGFESMVFPFSNYTRVGLYATGGEGGRGGDGGAGGDGKTGEDGQNASQMTNGTDGGPGGDGGDGGKGGRGGDAGNSANIEIYVRSEDLDLLTTFHYTDCRAAPGGNGGRGGSGGIGGNGGRGGMSYSWTETREEWDSQTNTNKSYSQHCSNPGGSSGQSGISGHRGQDGVEGRDGISGEKFYLVSYRGNGSEAIVKVYSSLYDLFLSGIQWKGISGGIFEPGQTISIHSFQVENRGGMESPGHVEITVDRNAPALLSNHISLLKDSIRTNQSILQGTSGILTSPDEYLAFKINPADYPGDNTALSLTSSIQFKSRLYRTGYVFPEFHSLIPNYPFRIEYPVEISMVSGTKTALYNSKSPWAIKILNKSHHTIGNNPIASINKKDDQPDITTKARYVQLKIDFLPSDETNSIFNQSDNLLFELLLEDGSYQRFTILQQPIIINISSLGPLEEMILQGYATVKDGAVPVYSSLNFQFSLFLSDIDHPLSLNHLKLIQRERYFIQVTESRRDIISPNDILLVINSDIERTQILYWLDVIDSLGFQANVWNTSLYHGFCYDSEAYHILKNGHENIVIILNSSFALANTSDQKEKFYPLQYLNSADIFEAARRFGLRAYIVNNQSPSTSSSMKGAGGNGNASPLPGIRRENEILSQLKRLIQPTRSLEMNTEQNLLTNHIFSGRKKFLQALYDNQEYSSYQTNEKLLLTQPNLSYHFVKIKLYHVFTTPSESVFNSRADEFISMLSDHRPDRSYYLLKHYQSAMKLRGLLFKRYELGHVEIRRGLDKSYGMIACRGNTKNLLLTNPSELDEESQGKLFDSFILLKLLSFDQKLALFDRAPIGRDDDLPMASASATATATNTNTNDSKILDKEEVEGTMASQPASPIPSPSAPPAASVLPAFLSIRERIYHEQLILAILSDIMDELKVYFHHINKFRMPWKEYNSKLQVRNIFTTLQKLVHYEWKTPLNHTKKVILQEFLMKVAVINKLYYQTNLIGNAITPQLSNYVVELWQFKINSAELKANLEKEINALVCGEIDRLAFMDALGRAKTDIFNASTGPKSPKEGGSGKNMKRKVDVELAMSLYRDPYQIMSYPDKYQIYLNHWILPGSTSSSAYANWNQQDFMLSSQGELVTDVPTASVVKASLDDHFMDGKVLQDRIEEASRYALYHPKDLVSSMDFLQASDRQAVYVEMDGNKKGKGKSYNYEIQGQL